MPAPLTRRALYDLVWSKPRTTIAREMGVSDVWIGKQCRAMNVPMPPRGYWANLAAGAKAKRKYVRPPLTFTLAERIEEDHLSIASGLGGFDANDLRQPVPDAPVFGESFEQAVARYAALASGQSRKQRPVGRHPVVLHLLEEDQRRIDEASPYAWRKPLYVGPQGRAVLDAIDRLAWHWEACGFRVSASRGHDVYLYVSCGRRASGFDVRPVPQPERKGRRGSAPAVAGLEFWLDPQRDPRDGPGEPAMVFQRVDAEAVDAVTRLLIETWERGFREGVQWEYENQIRMREHAIRKAQEAERREREKREAEARALRHRRHRLLLRAVERARTADAIRAFVAELLAKEPGAARGTEDAQRWTTWALDTADALDLRVQATADIEAWMREFAL